MTTYMNKERKAVAEYANRVARDGFLKMLAVTLSLGALMWACTRPAAETMSSEIPRTLPPVRLNMERGTYYLPGCEMYDGLVDRVRLELATAQEAELSGYHIGKCPSGARDARIAAERASIGELRATAETQERRDRLRLHHQTAEIEGELQHKIDDRR